MFRYIQDRDVMSPTQFQLGYQNQPKRLGDATSFDKRTSIYLLLLYRGISFSIETP